MPTNPNASIRPRIQEEDIPFWEATRNHEFRMQHCRDCGSIWWPPGPVCPDCWSSSYEWTELDGTGTINSWVVFHRTWFEAFSDDLPYNVVEVELTEGPRYISNLVDCENDEIYRGMAVEVLFEPLTDEIVLPKFRPR